MDRPLSYEDVRCCLHMRVAASDFMDYNVDLLLPEQVQLHLSRDLETIAASNPYYVKLFLAKYIKLLELANAAVDDTLYELYCLSHILGATPLLPTAIDTLEYVVDGEGTTIQIKETPKIISGLGTTGLRTWEAALYLLAYLNSTTGPNLQNKNIVELGAGTGLVSLALAKTHERHNFAHLVVTDGDSALVDGLAATFAYNDVDANVSVATQQLLWGTTDAHDAPTFVQGVPLADIVVAADVTYDALVVPQLASTLADFFKAGASEAYVAATVRNLDTISVWEQALLVTFVWDICAQCLAPHTEATVGWFRRGTPEIRIYRLQGLKSE